MTQYYIKRYDAETKMNKWCTDNGKAFVPYNGTYKLAMEMKVALFNEKGECVADVL